MKKVLSIALALVMVLSLSVTAFADGSENLWESASSGNISVQAKIVPIISAAVTWGDMQFTYYEQGELWNANGTNGVTVTNTTGTGRSINTSYSYARYDNKGETTMLAGWTVIEDDRQDPGVYIANDGFQAGVGYNKVTSALNALGTTLAYNTTQKFWLLFTTNANVSTLPSSDFAQVGTLTVTIAAA